MKLRFKSKNLFEVTKTMAAEALAMLMSTDGECVTISASVFPSVKHIRRKQTPLGFESAMETFNVVVTQDLFLVAPSFSPIPS